MHLIEHRQHQAIGTAAALSLSMTAPPTPAAKTASASSTATAAVAEVVAANHQIGLSAYFSS